MTRGSPLSLMYLSSNASVGHCYGAYPVGLELTVGNSDGKRLIIALMTYHLLCPADEYVQVHGGGCCSAAIHGLDC